MALTEEETVRLLQNAAMNYFDNLNTTTKWVSFVNTVNKQTVKAFIQNALIMTANDYDASASNLSAKADDLEDLAETVSNL